MSKRLHSVIGYKFTKVTKEQRQVFSHNFGLKIVKLDNYPLVDLFMNPDGVTWGNTLEHFEKHSFSEAWLHSDGHAYTYPEVNDLISDPVNHPEHYTKHPSGIECIQVTEHMSFNLGNAVKYIWRADLKGKSEEDLEKAIWYLQRELTKRRSADED